MTLDRKKAERLLDKGAKLPYRARLMTSLRRRCHVVELCGNDWTSHRMIVTLIIDVALYDYGTMIDVTYDCKTIFDASYNSKSEMATLYSFLGVC